MAKRYVAALSRALMDAGRRFNMTVFATVWADAIEHLSAISEWGATLTGSYARRPAALELAWTEYRAAATEREQYEALTKLMAAAAWTALPSCERPVN